MHDVNKLQRALRESQESRRRGWKALQEIREVLKKAGECDLPPPASPPCFEAEGRVLRIALAETIRHLLMEIRELKVAIEAIHPAIGSASRPEGFPQLLIRLNRALVTPHVEPGALEKFRR
jgi:hypothetical protein